MTKTRKDKVRNALMRAGRDEQTAERVASKCEATLYRDQDYGALALFLTRDGIVEVEHGCVDRDFVHEVLQRYASPRRTLGTNETLWRVISDAHPAAVLSTVEHAMQGLGYETDPLAERAIRRVTVDEARKPDLPVAGRVPLVHEAVEQGVRQHLGMVVAALRESGPASVPSLRFFERPNAVAAGGRKPPFAVARFFCESKLAEGRTLSDVVQSIWMLFKTPQRYVDISRAERGLAGNVINDVIDLLMSKGLIRAVGDRYVQTGKGSIDSVVSAFESRGPAEVRARVLEALEPWKNYLVKCAVHEGAVEVGIALSASICEQFLGSALPTFSEAVTGARLVEFTVERSITEQERRELEERCRSCTGAVSLQVEGNRVVAQVPSGFVGHYMSDAPLQERISWLNEALSPWGPQIVDVGELQEVQQPQPERGRIQEILDDEPNLTMKQRQSIWNDVGAGVYNPPFKATGYRRMWSIIDRDGQAIRHPAMHQLSVQFTTPKAANVFILSLNRAAGLPEAVSECADHGQDLASYRRSVNEEEDGGYEVADFGLPPDVNTMLTQFTGIKQHLWDTPQVQTVLKKAKKLVKDKHGEDVAKEFDTRLDIARATACQESINESLLNEVKDASVSTWLVLIGGALTRYDQMEAKRESKRGSVNIYRLGLLFKALEGVKHDMARGKYETRDDADALTALRQSMKKHFTFDNGRFGILHLNALDKKITAWLDGGKFPKYESVLSVESEQAGNYDRAMELRGIVKAGGTFQPAGDGDAPDKASKPSKPNKDDDEEDATEESAFPRKMAEAYFSKDYASGAWPKDKAKLIRIGMPKEVQAVADEAYKSAVDGTREARDEMKRLYAPGSKYADPSMLRNLPDYTGDVSVAWYGASPHNAQPNSWSVTNGLEDGPTGMYFYLDDNRWYYDGYYGKKPMPGGQREALSNAELMFHG